MPRFSANISTLFTELPLLERIEGARRAGFAGIEIQFPYDTDPFTLKTCLDEARLPLALCNFPAGDLVQDGEGYAAIPGREKEFRDALEQASEYAQILRPRAMNLLSGRPVESRDASACLRTFEAHLAAAQARLSPLGVRLVTEAINPFDMPRFFLSRATQVLQLIDRLPCVDFTLQFDIYHASRVGEDPARLLRENMDRIGHIQFADYPGRGEPGSGGIDFAALFELIDRSGYDGFVGAEYFPTGETSASLSWLHRFASPASEH